ncbi:guanylate kinase [Lentimicrobium saccharophilum]|uniref:Guanylate kinase n=1 Tax=Lentimicrobium saccharophilum TaxID=1678841 RepID=A0A0S7BS92_9BACT|nr:guanylate kinase [Lentimicrobium saccharophilum]GAP43516.1 guanylate kinase [Lentimicrobium saccharophilum]
MNKPKESEGKLIIVSAPSGAGKTTIVKYLLASGLNLGFSVSATSRQIRPNEVDGKDYFFITSEAFRKKIEEGDLLEWQEVYEGNFYGTLKSQVKILLDQGKNIIFDVDVVGGLNIKNYFGDRALSVFVSPPSLEELENRLRFRKTDSEETINRRMEKARWELGFAPRFDYILVNNDLETAKKEAHKVVTEFLKPKY